MFRIKNLPGRCLVSSRVTSIKRRRSRIQRPSMTWKSTNQGRPKTIKGTYRSIPSPEQVHITSTPRASHTAPRATPVRRRASIHSNVDLNPATVSRSSLTPLTVLCRKSQKATCIKTHRTTPWSPSGRTIRDTAPSRVNVP